MDVKRFQKSVNYKTSLNGKSLDHKDTEGHWILKPAEYPSLLVEGKEDLASESLKMADMAMLTSLMSLVQSTLFLKPYQLQEQVLVFPDSIYHQPKRQKPLME